MNIFLIHQYAGNKGDRAVLVGLVYLLKREYPDVRITVSTSNPEMWRSEDLIDSDHVEFCPGGWNFSNADAYRFYFRILNYFHKYAFTVLRFLTLHRIRYFLPFLANPQFYEKLKKADVVMSVGGHHYTTILSRDLVSDINYDSMCVITANKPLILFSQSFGPYVFHNPRNKLLTQTILNYCSSIFYREQSSLSELQKLPVQNPMIKETRETVLLLNSTIKERLPVTRRKKQIGIAIYSTQKRTEDQLNDYCNAISGFASSVIRDGFRVLFFPMELKGSPPDDRWLIQRILAQINSDKASFIDEDLPTVKHLQSVMECSMFIGHKTHSTIFSIVTGTPLIGICYHPKTLEFMRQFACEEYAVDDKELTAEMLYSAYEKLGRNLELVSEKFFALSAAAGDVISHDLRTAIEQIPR